MILYTLYHEVGHAIIDVYDLPTTGLEENVADQFAAYILSLEYTGDYDYSISHERLAHVSLNYQYNDMYWNTICPEEAETPEDAADCLGINYAWDVHGLDIQRFYNVSCYSYGADPERNPHMIDEGLLPEDRAVYCEDEYWQLDHAWSYLLSDFTNGLFDPVE